MAAILSRPQWVKTIAGALCSCEWNSWGSIQQVAYIWEVHFHMAPAWVAIGQSCQVLTGHWTLYMNVGLCRPHRSCRPNHCHGCLRGGRRLFHSLIDMTSKTSINHGWPRRGGFMGYQQKRCHDIEIFFLHCWPFMRETTGYSGFPSQRARNAELWCFLWCKSELIRSGDYA